MRRPSRITWTLVGAGAPDRQSPWHGPLRWFLSKSLSFQFLAALVLVFGVALGSLTLWLSHRATSRLLDATAETAAFYVQNLLQPHIQTLALRQDLSAEDLEVLHRLTTQFREQGHFLAIKIWHPDGRLAFAPADGGPPEASPESPPEELAEALHGKVVGRLSDLGDNHHDPERAFGVPLYEIYAPLYDLETGRILAVGEFYQNAEKMSRALVATTRGTWLFVLPFGVAVFLLLYLIVRRGSRTIERQHQALVQRIEDQRRLHALNQGLSRRMTEALQNAARIDDLRQQRLGADLHDGAGQLLAFLLLKMDRLKALIRSPDVDDRDSAAEIVDDMADSAQQALEEIRVVSNGLISPYLAHAHTLHEAVEAIEREHRRRGGGPVALDLACADRAVPEGPLRTLARILQEALSNTLRHARGSEVELFVGQEDSDLVMRICDRGPGPGAGRRAASGGATGGLGVPGMRFRAETLGGTLEIAPRQGGGTRVTCRIPLATLDQESDGKITQNV